MIITNNKILIDAALKNYDVFKVPANKVGAKKSVRYYTAAQKADLDYKTSENKIGEIVNLSQELNSLMWDKINNSDKTVAEIYDEIKEIYHDICILNVLSCIEIDKAKKEFDISSTKEIKKIKSKWDRESWDNKTIKPAFLGFIAQTKGYRDPSKKKYDYHKTTMDYVLRELNSYRSQKTDASSLLPLSECFEFEGFNQNSVNKKQTSKIVKMCETSVSAISAVWAKEYYTVEEKYILAERLKDDLVYDIRKMAINKHTLYALIRTTDMKKYSHISKLLFFALFNYKNDLIIEIMNNLNEHLSYIKEHRNGEIELYNMRFRRYGGNTVDKKGIYQGDV